MEHPSSPRWRTFAVLLHHRLLQFLGLGGILYALAPETPSPGLVEISPDDRAALHQAHAQRTGLARLSPAEAQAVDRRALEDEVLYREALRLGLDRNDNVVKQRLVQKVLFLAEDLHGASRPATEADLRRYFQRTRERWRAPARARFLHIYAQRPEALEALRRDAQAADQAAPQRPPSLGEAFPLSRDVTLDAQALARDYGDEFARQVLQLPPQGGYHGPLQSRHGYHLVKLLQKDPERPATYEEVRGELPLSYLITRKQEATAAFLQQALSRYELRLGGQTLKVHQAKGRLLERGQEGMD